MLVGMMRMPMRNFVRKACVFASFLLAGSSVATVSAEAHSRKWDHHFYLSAAHRHVAQPESLSLSERYGGVLVRNDAGTLGPGYPHGHADMERVTYEVHRHGRTTIHTMWRQRRYLLDAGAEPLYGTGIYNTGWMECVPYARRVSGIELTGDAYLWWGEAAGRYDRGNTPVAGSVLNFRSNGRMRLGHVAVVTEVVNQREIVVTQANWGGSGFSRGDITRGTSVVDVSPDNDWTAVRVALGNSPRYGSVYPTYGFIYGHNTPSTLMADAAFPAPQILTDRPPADLRTNAERSLAQPAFRQTIEFAAAPSFDSPAIETSVPDRSLR
jgi:hypothetical protein